MDSEGNANRANVARFCREVGLEIGDLNFHFVAGSIFWFKPRVLQLLNRMPIDIQEFEGEPAQKDGTLAHAFERFFGLLAQQEGFEIAEINSNLKMTMPSTGSLPNYRWATATRNGKVYVSSKKMPPTTNVGETL